jgi:hypothetical protein
MPLPAGFKVNGSKVPNGGRVPPRVTKIMAILDKVPYGELLTSNELGARAVLSVGGSWTSHPALFEYREKVDNRFFWGSRKSIARLREQLVTPEESHENQ